MLVSDNRQTNSVDFLIDVERIHVGHAADIVDNSHDARFKIGRADVILAAHAADELARVEPLRIDSRLGHDLHQAVHNLKTAQFDVKHRLALVDSLFRKFGAVAVSLNQSVVDAVDKTAAELAPHNFVLVPHERVNACPFERVDNASPHVYHLLVVVGYFLVVNSLHDMILPHFIEEIQEKPLCLLVRYNLQLVGILNVHNLVADVVGSLYKIHQRMARILGRTAVGRLAYYAEVVGNAAEYVGFGAENPNLPCPFSARADVKGYFTIDASVV